MHEFAISHRPVLPHAWPESIGNNFDRGERQVLTLARLETTNCWIRVRADRECSQRCCHFQPSISACSQHIEVPHCAYLKPEGCHSGAACTPLGVCGSGIQVLLRGSYTNRSESDLSPASMNSVV
jgi:hypothetical protein